ncbi:MAG: hypothetical protein JXR72_00690 [Proteobacteria bacterium]|nr:hypothetical protein [Pseudomonadota bacterium]
MTMDPSQEAGLARRYGYFLGLLSATQATAGIFILSALLLLTGPKTLALAVEHLGMSGRTLAGMTVFLLLLVTASGLVSFFRVRYGWFFVFLVASLLLLAAILHGPGTVSLTRVNFTVLLILSGLSWALAVVYYLWDLYT